MSLHSLRKRVERLQEIAGEAMVNLYLRWGEEYSDDPEVAAAGDALLNFFQSADAAAGRRLSPEEQSLLPGLGELMDRNVMAAYNAAMRAAEGATNQDEAKET